MKEFRSIALGLMLCSMSFSQAFAWAKEGHAVVAALAASVLSPTSRAKVQELLREGGNEDLISVASWPDEVLIAAHDEGPLRGNQEAIEFNQKFPKSGMWHFVNLPLGASSYDQVRAFTNPDDVIHLISRCIDVLESPRPGDGDFTKVQALRLLVHFVGDIHQPLHCGTGFYSFSQSDIPQLISDPQQALGKANDRGGNLLFYSSNNLLQVHALWDRILVQEVDNSIDYRVLADFLKKNYLSKEIPPTQDDYHKWAEIWAIESVHIAALAYQGITFGRPEFDSNNQLVRIDVSLPPNYEKENQPRAALQLARAGVRLAQLLDRINWK